MANPNAVYQIAREIFYARNGGSTPASLRREVKQAIRGTTAVGGRGPLRMALMQAKYARDSFRHGRTDIATKQLMLARYWMEKAAIVSAAIQLSKNSAAKRVSAKASRKVTPEIEASICRLYKRHVDSTGTYGAIKYVASEIEKMFGEDGTITRQTISTVIKKNLVK